MIYLVSTTTFLVGLVLGSFIMGIAIEYDFEKYLLGLASPFVISFSIGIAGFISYRALLENRIQAQKNRTLDAIEKLESLVDEIRIVDVNFHNWQEMNKINNAKHNFREMVKEMPNELLHEYHRFALACDKLALGVLDGTYHETLVMQLALGTFWNHWQSLKLYIGFIRAGSSPFSHLFCTGLEEYLKTKGGLSLSKYHIPKYTNDVFEFS